LKTPKRRKGRRLPVAEAPLAFPHKLASRSREMGVRNQKQLADLMGTVSRATVSRWFSGLATPDMYQASRLAMVLDVPTDWLADEQMRDIPRMARTELERDIWWMIDRLGLERSFRTLVKAEAMARQALAAEADEPTPQPGTSYAEEPQPIAPLLGPRPRLRKQA
jgi:transcriptional regulator with XRE-family HTH domain